MARKKKKGKQKQDNVQATADHQCLNSHVTEELEALEAIFGDLYSILSDGMGCKVSCIPFPGGSDKNDVVVSLEARFPEHYPQKPVHVQLSEVAGLRQSDVEVLQKLLEAKAFEYAESGMVAVHNLASDCSDWLRTATRSDGNEQGSLYEAYQQRETETKPDSKDYRNRFATLTSDWVNRPAIPGLQEMQLGSRTATSFSAARDASDGQEAPPARDPKGTGMEAEAPRREAADEEESGALRNGAQGNVSRSGPLAGVLSRSVGLVTSLAQSMRGLRSRRGGGDWAHSRNNSTSGSALLNDLLQLDSAEACRQALSIAALSQNFSTASVSATARQDMVEQLVKAGVVSPTAGAVLLAADGIGMRDFTCWVDSLDSTMCPPALKDMLVRGFTASDAAPAKDDGGADALGSGMKAARVSSRVSVPPAPARAMHVRDARSRRYELEFIEQERLGQGGFGVVVAAINRIDGRRYAVKKIPMTGHDIGSNTLREVSTLSGLHHGHIVRYYQAWREHVDHRIDDSTSVDESGGVFARRTYARSDSVPAAPSGLGQHTRTATIGSNDSDALLPVGRGQVLTNTHSGLLDTVKEASQDLGSTPSQGRIPIPLPAAQSSVSGTKSAGSASSRVAGEARNQNASPGAEESVPRQKDRNRCGGVPQWDEGSSGLENDSTDQLASVVFRARSDGEESAAQSLSSSDGFSDSTGSFQGTSEGGNSAFTFAHSQSQQGAADSVATSSPPPKLSQEVLYIQMEFCPTTLKRQLGKGQVADEHAWRVLRQLLSALAYLHQRGIIHRDVKPDNVFYDSRNDIKLGDFGLAKFTTQESSAVAGGQDHPRHSRQRSLDPTAEVFSKDVGTELYIAPEVRAGQQYGSKVDLFAVGIIVVELWSHFGTEMERISTLLRARDGVLPDSMLSNHPMATKLATALLQKDPMLRPGAAEVLKSHMIPATATDEQVSDLLRAMPEHPGMYNKIVDALFAESGGSGVDDPTGVARGGSDGDLKPDAQLPANSDITAAGVPVAGDSSVQLSIMRCVERFSALARGTYRQSILRFGVAIAGRAYSSQENMLGAAAASHLTSAAAVKLLSSSGQQLALRNQDLRTPFCIWLAAQAQGASASSTASFSGPGLESMRRYEISQVYMQNRDTPKWLAAIDIVRAGADCAVGRDAPMLAEAELIRMVCDVCSSVEALKGCSIDIQLSHASLLVGVLDHVGVDATVQDSFLHALQTLMASRLPGEKGHAAGLKSKAWATFCQQLQQLNLPVGRAKPLLLSVPTEPSDAVKWLRSVLPQAADSTSPTAQALTDVDKLIDMLSVCELGQSEWCSVSVNPFLLIPSREYRDVIFQINVWMDKAGEAEVAGECVCTGGCYSSFLDETWPWQLCNEQIPAPLASGATIDLSTLTDFASKLELARTSALAARRLSTAEVLVASRGGGGMLKERMAVVSLLWRAGNLPAETMQVLEPSAKQQYLYAHARGVKALVILESPSFELKEAVKVKLLDRKAADAEVSKEDLVAHLVSVLGPVARS